MINRCMPAVSPPLQIITWVILEMHRCHGSISSPSIRSLASCSVAQEVAICPNRSIASCCPGRGEIKVGTKVHLDRCCHTTRNPNSQVDEANIVTASFSTIVAAATCLPVWMSDCILDGERSERIHVGRVPHRGEIHGATRNGLRTCPTNAVPCCQQL